MQVKIKAEVEIPDDEVLDAIDRKDIENREGVVGALTGAEFRIELDGLSFMFNIVDAEAR